MAKRYTPRKQLAELFLIQNGLCKCGVRLVKGSYIIEHSTPLALGGLDVFENKYLQCRDCANIKTYGHSKATTYGSDIHAIAKTRRLRGELKPKMKRAWPSKEIPSRPFPTKRA